LPHNLVHQRFTEPPKIRPWPHGGQRRATSSSATFELVINVKVAKALGLTIRRRCSRAQTS